MCTIYVTLIYKDDYLSRRDIKVKHDIQPTCRTLYNLLDSFIYK